MKQTLIAFFAVVASIAVSTATVEARPSDDSKVKTNEMITINKYGKTWRVTKATAVQRCEASQTDAKRKNWALYCEYVKPAVAEKKCQFLFWETECSAIRNDEPRKIAVQDDGGIPGVLPGVNPNRKQTLYESTPRTGVLARAESTIGLNARRDRQTLKQQLSRANGMTVDPARIPWCAAWMNMVLDESGLPTTGSLMARSFLAWGKPVAGEPKIGDVVVMRRGRNRNMGHVGFFYAFVDVQGQKMVAVLGGNQGKEVRVSYYPITKVIAYRTAA